MRVIVEFTGIARSIAGSKQVTLEMPEGTTYRDIVRRLGKENPQFINILIAPDGEDFLSSNMFVINGDLAFPAMVMDEHPKDGELIHLMSVITGG